MTPKEKAQELINIFKNYVHGYVGSSMLDNYEYPERILSQAKEISLIAVDELIADCDKDVHLKFWNDVRSELVVATF
jgi:hypothetical protein